MSTDLTKRMLDLYVQKTSPTMFLSGFFGTPPRNYYNAAQVEIDIQRFGEKVSVVVQDLSTTGRQNSANIYTNKQFIAPIHDEVGALNSFDMIKREAGAIPFADLDFQAAAGDRALTLATEMEDKIKRAIELQASQVLQTGKLSLKDSTGAVIYALDYSPKTTHFPSAVTAWNASGSTPIADLDALAVQIRKDGRKSPDQLIMGEGAFEAFVSHTDVQSRLDNRRIDLGTVAPVAMQSDAGTYMGVVHIGNYNFDIWTYNGYYDDVETDATTSFVDPAKVIMRASVGRLDATYGGIPNFGNPAAGILPFLPPRFPNVAGGTDLFLNAWLEPNGRQISISVAARPLLIPTAIDTFGCLATGV